MKVKKILTNSVKRKRRTKEKFQRMWLTVLTNKMRKKIQKQYKKTGSACVLVHINDYRIDNIDKRLELLQESGQITFEATKYNHTGAKAVEYKVYLTDLLPIVSVTKTEAEQPAQVNELQNVIKESEVQ